MHKLLQRQLRRFIKGPAPTAEEWSQFLGAVSEAYEASDQDRALLERSLEISSQELTQINENLRQDMATQERLQKTILQTEKMGAIGQLAAGVAHEINNPLGVIFGFAQSLTKRLKPGDPMELPIKSIEREATRCKNLVQDLLTFSRASQIERAPMDLNAAVQASLSLIQAQSKVGRCTITTTLASRLPHIDGNQNQVQQVIINLSNNAFDAMPQGGALVIKTEYIHEIPRSWVCLKVMDTGAGIPSDILPHIFEPFFTTKEVGKGTGLGLSLIYEIVTKHSGTIDVYSRPGHTEFVVKLPTCSTPD
jgi:signal transduction histidine kinase